MIDPAAGRRIEHTLAQSARHYAEDHRALFPEHGAEVLAVGTGGFAVWGSAFGAPNVSRAFAIAMDRAVAADELSRVEDFYARHEAVTRVVTCPWTNPSLFPLLAARGYRVDRFDNVLTCAITSARERGREAPGVAVAIVPRGGAVGWGSLVRQGFGMDPADTTGATIDAVFDISKSTTLFVATVDGERAGGGALVLLDGMAFLLATSVLEAHRRRGVHAALVAARVAHARESSADLAVVITEPGSDSQRNLEENCGFRVGYTETIFLK